MISRPSTRFMAELYETQFVLSQTTAAGRNQKPTVDWDQLYNFLYDRDYSPVFLNVIERAVATLVPLRDFIMRIHTGDSLNVMTSTYTDKQKVELSQSLLKKLAQDILVHMDGKTRPNISKPYPGTGSAGVRAIMARNDAAQRPYDLLEHLERQLELDGYIFQDGRLMYTDSAVIEVEEEQIYLINLVEKVPINNKQVILNHLKLAEQHYVDSKFGDSISNARNFLEEIINQVAEFVRTEKGILDPLPTEPFKRRAFLKDQGFFDEREKQAIDKTYGFLSDRGSHPNIAAEHEARLMRNLALAFSQYILLRFQEEYM